LSGVVQRYCNKRSQRQYKEYAIHSSDGTGQEFRDPASKIQLACRSTDLTSDRLTSFWWNFFMRCCYIWNKYNLVVRSATVIQFTTLILKLCCMPRNCVWKQAKQERNRYMQNRVKLNSKNYINSYLFRTWKWHIVTRVHRVREFDSSNPNGRPNLRSAANGSEVAVLPWRYDTEMGAVNSLRFGVIRRIHFFL